MTLTYIYKEADPNGSASCVLQGGIELSEGSARVPLRSIHPSELRSFGSRSRGRGRPRSVRAFRQLHSGDLKSTALEIVEM